MATVDPIRRCAQPTSSKKPARPTHGTCRLTLHINGTSYHVRPTPTDAFAALKAFRLRKADGTSYDVAQTVHGPECDCPDFIFHRDGLDPCGCKHIKALLAVGLLVADSHPNAKVGEQTPPGADEPDWDAMYRETHAKDCLERGLIPSDVADYIAQTTLVGHQP